MTVDILLILVACSIVLAWLRWRRCSRVLLVLAVAWVLVVGCGLLPGLLLTRLQSGFAADQPVAWGQRNAIVLLGAGTVRVAGTDQIEPGLFAQARINKAAVLYHACEQTGHECLLEVSGGDARGLGQSEAEVYAGILRQLGVDDGDLLLESRSMNTWQNAQFSGPLLEAYGADRVLLVSSGFHLRRGMLYFSHFGIHATPVSADHLGAITTWMPLAWNFAMADVALHEYAGVARYHWYNLMGWNARAVEKKTVPSG